MDYLPALPGALASGLQQDRLKRWFGYFLVVMGLYILARSTPEALGLTL